MNVTFAKSLTMIILNSFILCAPVSASVPTTQERMIYYAEGWHGGLFLSPEAEFHSNLIELLDLLDGNDGYKVVLEIEGYAWEEVSKKQNFLNLLGRLRHYIDEGRVEMIGSYTQPYLYPNCGESVIRQLLSHKRVVWDLFKQDILTYGAQEPCFTTQLPQFLSGLGIRYCVLNNINLVVGAVPMMNTTKVWWVGPDGSMVETSPRYGVAKPLFVKIGQINLPLYDPLWGSYLGDDRDPTIEFMNRCYEAGMAKPLSFRPEDFGLFAVISRDTLINKPQYIHVKWTTLRDYFNDTPKPDATDTWSPTDQDNLVTHPWDNPTPPDDFLPFVWGLLGGMLQLGCSEAERGVLTAERLAALRSLYLNVSYPSSELREAWKYLMMAQHHDAWVSVPIAIHFASSWTDRSIAISNQIIESCLESAASQINTVSVSPGTIRSLVVFNTVTPERSSIARVTLTLDMGEAKALKVLGSDGKEVSSQANVKQRYDDGSLKEVELLFLASSVPQLGYKVFHVTAGEPEEVLRGTKATRSGKCTILENEFYRLTIDPQQGGCITSLYDKQLEREFINSSRGLGNDYTGYVPEMEGFVNASDSQAEVTVMEDGPLRAHVLIKGKFHETSQESHIYLYKGVKRIDFEVTFNFQEKTRIGASETSSNPDLTDWRFNEKKLRVLFPLALENVSVYRDAAFDAAKTDKKAFYGLSWVDISDTELGFSLYSDRPAAYLYDGGTVSMVLAYGGRYILGEGFPHPPPTYLEGNKTYGYSISTHDGGWSEARVPHQAAGYHYPLLTTLTSTHGGTLPREMSFISFSSPNPMVTTVYGDDGNLYLRLLGLYRDEEKVTVTFHKRVKRLYLAKLDGSKLEEFTSIENGSTSSVSITLDRFQLRTIELPSSAVKARTPLTEIKPIPLGRGDNIAPAVILGAGAGVLLWLMRRRVKRILSMVKVKTGIYA